MTHLSLERSQTEMKRARSVIASGLSSFARVRDNQVVFSRGSGAYLWDVDGNRYIDCVCAHGPILLGHGATAITNKVSAAIADGTLLGGPHVAEADLAEQILTMLPWAGKVAYANSGTEAVQLALRIARATTGKHRVIKFDGHFHGWMDPVYVNCPGVNPAFTLQAETAQPLHSLEQVRTRPNVLGQSNADDVVVGKWNDLTSFEELMREVGESVAAVILEPFATNFGTFPPAEGYLEGLISIAHQYGALVIFDEIVTGFRLAPGGAVEKLGVAPDLATYAKAVGSGFPISFVVGSEAAMAVLDDGRVLTAGTYSGSVAAVHAAKATLDEIQFRGPKLYEHLECMGQRLRDGFETVGRELNEAVTANQVGSLVQVLLGNIESRNSIAGVNMSDKTRLSLICEAMIQLGVYTSRKGLFYLNASHTADDIDAVIDAFRIALLEEREQPVTVALDSNLETR